MCTENFLVMFTLLCTSIERTMLKTYNFMPDVVVEFLFQEWPKQELFFKEIIYSLYDLCAVKFARACARLDT